MPSAPALPAAPALPGAAAAAPKPKKPKGPKVPKRGDFDAGGNLRFPNGPDSTGKYSTWNWIAADAKGRYFLLDTVTVNADIPLAVHHPGELMDGSHPSMFGGFTARLDATLPKLPSIPGLRNDTQIGLTATFSYMRAGALLLSDKDFPKFEGRLAPGTTVGLITKIKLSSLLFFSLQPVWLHQGHVGEYASTSAVQIPMQLIIGLGSFVKLNADVGVFTGPDYSFSGGKGGRVYAGASVDVRIAFIAFHLGAGFATLETGPDYPTIGDSLYFEATAKYAR